MVPLLIAGSIACAVVGALGIVARVRGRRASTQPDPPVGRWYWIVVVSEFVLAGAGAAVLGATGHDRLIAGWVCLVVGIHFLPLNRTFPGIGMIGLAVAVALVAAASLVIGMVDSVQTSVIAGPGAGLCLLAHAAGLLVASRRATVPA